MKHNFGQSYKFLAKLSASLIAATILTFALPQSSSAIPQSSITQEGLHEFSRFVGQYSVSTDGSVNGRQISVSKAVGATTLKAAYLVLVSQGANNRTPCSANAQMTLSGDSVNFTHLASGGVFNDVNSTAFCNYFVDMTATLSSTLTSQTAGTVTGFPILYDTSKYTGAALTAVFDNPTADNGTVIYQFGHAPASGATTTISFTALSATPQAESAILSLGIGWSVQDQAYNASTEGYNKVRLGTSSQPNPVDLSTYAGGYDDGSNGNGYSELITVGDFADSSANPTGSWANNRSDDELYDISSYLSAGDTSLTMYSDNASVNDTIFQLVLHLKSILSGSTVTFDANGGTGTLANQIGSGITALAPNTLQRTGWDFAGWNTLQNGIGTTYSDQALYDFDADATLYAQWAPVATPPVTVHPEPATYYGPIPILLDPNPVFSSKSNLVTLTGKRLLGITRAVIDGKEIEINSVGPEKLLMTLPPLAAGTYTILYYSGYGSLSHLNSLTVIDPPKSVETVEPLVKVSKFLIKKRFSTFIGDTAKQPVANRVQMQKYISDLNGIQKVTCIGSTSGVPAEVSDISLARARANTACDYVKSLFPNVTVSVRTSTGKGFGQFYRAVTIFASGVR